MVVVNLPKGRQAQVVARPTVDNSRRQASAALTAANTFSSNADNITQGTVQPDQLPLATATSPGIVQPDEVTIHVDTAGIINAITATVTSLGVVQPDGTSIVIDPMGIISAPGTGGGAVTSVGLALPAEFVVTGSPVTTAGTLTGSWANETANRVFAGPTTGSPAVPAFRTLVAADLPIATSSDFGAVKPDNVTITITAGVLTALGSVAGANPTATAGPTAINGVATTYMRSDAAPAVQLGTSSQKGLVQVDGTTITASSGVISAVHNGTVTSVALTMPSIFSVASSPITTSGTLAVTLVTETANTVFSGPVSGGAAVPTFRALVAADIPSLPYVSTTLTSAHILVGNVSNVATSVAVSGDVSLLNTGEIDLVASGIAKINQRIWIGI